VRIASPAEVMEQKLSVPQCVKALGVSRTSVHRLIHTGELRAFRVGTTFQVPISSLQVYLGEAFVQPKDGSND
jgi:excisionase family DNA binding protein